MTRSARAVILAILALLIVLAFWPEPTRSDVPVTSGPIPSSAFVPLSVVLPSPVGSATVAPRSAGPDAPGYNPALQLPVAISSVGRAGAFGFPDGLSAGSIPAGGISNPSPTPAAPVASVPPALATGNSLVPDSSPAPQAAQSRAGTPSSATHQSPAATPTMASKLAGVGGSVVVGVASTYGPGFDGYLALPAGPGVRVRICGAGGCIDRVSNDAGPVPSLHRVADLDVTDFEYVCAAPWTRGLCRVTVEVLR